jgi:hypothetical protein
MPASTSRDPPTGAGGANALQHLHALAAGAGVAPGCYSVLVPHGDPAQQIIAHEQEQAPTSS